MVEPRRLRGDHRLDGLLVQYRAKKQLCLCQAVTTQRETQDSQRLHIMNFRMETDLIQSFSLVVSEDVLEEMSVNAGEEGVQLVLFQQGGSVTSVQLCAILSGLKEQARMLLSKMSA